MKKQFLIVFVVLLPFLSIAQSFKGGFFAGISASQVSGDQLSGYNKPGLWGGFQVNHPLKQSTDIQLEMSYIDKGSRKSAHPDKGDYKSYKLILRYIDLSLLYRYSGKINIKQEEIIKSYGFSLEIGPYLGILINHKELDDNGIITPLPTAPKFHKFDCGGLIGFSYQINEKVALNFRNSTSLFPIRKHNGGAVYRLNRGQYNNALTVGLQFAF
jgi:hypothetical protein